MPTITGKLIWVAPSAWYYPYAQQTVVEVLVQDETGNVIPTAFMPHKSFVPPVLPSYTNKGEIYLALDAEAKTIKHRVQSNDPLVKVNPDETYDFDHIRIRAAIGDVVSIRWEYELCTTKILTLAPQRAELTKWEYDIRTERFDASDEMREYYQKHYKFGGDNS